MDHNGTPTRREALFGVAALAACSATARAQNAQAPLIDSHIHLVADNAEAYPPRPLRGTLRQGALDNPVTPERALKWMDETGVEKAVVVQRTQIYGYDNSYVLDAGEKFPSRFTAVACVNAEEKTAPGLVRHWIKDRGAAGVRLSATDTGASRIDWLASPRAVETWETVAEVKGSMCLLIRQEQRVEALTALAGLAERFPTLPIVVDHLSDAGGGLPNFGIDAPLQALKQFSNVRFKFSTINFKRLTEAGIPLDLFFRHWADDFGAHRLMWGSDIGNSSMAYGDMVRLARSATAALGAAGARNALGQTAQAIYGPHYRKA